MFPGTDGFTWTFGHVLFVALFLAVALTILATVGSAVWRTLGDFRTHRAIDLCWRSDFAEMPEGHRRCRHELASRVSSRACDNAFDCRHCSQYATFAALPAKAATDSIGINYREDCFYDRGHTWVKPEPDGTLTIGLDEFAEHLIADPDSVEMPDIGDEMEMHGTAWRIKKNGKQIRVRAPIEGTVTATGGPKEGWYLKLHPRLDPRDPATLRHLLRGVEVRGWLSREMERLQLQLSPPNTAPSLADGGALVPGLMDAIPEADWATVLDDTFLEA